MTILAYLFLFFLILCLYVLYYSLITIGLITLEHFWCWFLYTVFVSICTSYKVMVVLINICIFEYIHLLHIYYVIIAYLQDKVITLFYLCCFHCFLLFFFISDHELINLGLHSMEQFSCRLLYTVILYVCWYLSVMFVHIYTCMFVNIHLWYT